MESYLLTSGEYLVFQMNYQLHISPKKMLSILMAFYTIEDRNMKKLFSIFTILAAIMLTSSCQKELPDAVKNIDVSQGEKTPSPTPTPASELKVSEPGQFGAKGGD